MQLHVRSQARALDCVCSIISSRLHVRVKTYVYRVLWCKSCEAWHEVLFLLLLCARRWSRFGRITNFKIVFLILSIRPEHSLRFNRETLRFKWIKLYISNTHLTRLSDFTRFTSRGEYSNRESDFARWRKFRCPRKASSTFSFFRLCRVGGPSRRDYPRRRRLFRLFPSHARFLPSGIAGRAEKWRRKGRFFHAPIGPSRLHAQL